MTQSVVRVCRGCGVEKPLAKFHKANAVGDRRRRVCADCLREEKNARKRGRHVFVVEMRTRIRSKQRESFLLAPWPREINPPGRYGGHTGAELCEMCGAELWTLCLERVMAGFWTACEMPDMADLRRLETTWNPE